MTLPADTLAAIARMLRYEAAAAVDPDHRENESPFCERRGTVTAADREEAMRLHDLADEAEGVDLLRGADDFDVFEDRHAADLEWTSWNE